MPLGDRRGRLMPQPCRRTSRGAVHRPGDRAGDLCVDRSGDVGIGQAMGQGLIAAPTSRAVPPNQERRTGSRGRAEGGSALVAEIASERFSIRRASERSGDAVPRPVSCSSLANRHPQGDLSDSPSVDCRDHEFIEGRRHDTNSGTEYGTIRGVLRASVTNTGTDPNSTSMLRLDKGRQHPFA